MHPAPDSWALAIMWADLALAFFLGWSSLRMYRERRTSGKTSFPRELPIAALYALSALSSALSISFSRDAPHADAPGRLFPLVIFTAPAFAYAVFLAVQRRRRARAMNPTGSEIG